jgi:HAMP domain-containing protein
VVFGFLAIVTVGFIFLMLRRSMRPLEHLAMLASQISTGEGLDQPIKPTTTDEIGQMAKSLNRLRASLQAAMGRLGE